MSLFLAVVLRRNWEKNLFFIFQHMFLVIFDTSIPAHFTQQLSQFFETFVELFQSRNCYLIYTKTKCVVKNLLCDTTKLLAVLILKALVTGRNEYVSFLI